MQTMEDAGAGALPAGERFVAAAAVDVVGESPAMPGSTEAAAQKARDQALSQLGIAGAMTWGLSETSLVVVPKKGDVVVHHLREVAKPEATKKGVGFGKLGMSLKLVGIPFRVQGKKKDVDEFLFTLQQILQRNRGTW